MKNIFFAALVLLPLWSFAQEEVSLESADSAAPMPTEQPIMNEQPLVPTSETSGLVPVDPNAIEGTTVDPSNPTATEVKAEEPVDNYESPPVPTPSGVNVVNEASRAEMKSDDAAMEVASMPTLSSEESVYEKKLNARKPHWLVSFGFEGLEYELPWDYEGQEKSFDKQNRSLYGGRLGVGYEIYLGGNLMTSSRIEGFGVGTAFEKAQSANPLVDVDVASVKDSSMLYGIEAVQTLSVIFDLKTKNPFLGEMTYLFVEPFVEAGIGKAKSYHSRQYSFKTTIQEHYNHKIEDDITSARIGAGVMLTSNQGYFLYIRATQNRYDITDRKSRGSKLTNGGAVVSLKGSEKDVDIDPVMSYAIGGGYKF